jgi:hypothetical protein
MKNEELFFINQLMRLYQIKVNDSFLEDLKDTYRFSIKIGQRAVFINKAKENAEILSNINYEELFKYAGSNMSTLAAILGDYVEFQDWLSRMIGEPLVKNDIKLC